MSVRNLESPNELDLYCNSMSLDTLTVSAGSNKKMGRATLSSGVVVVSNSSVATGSNIFLCAQDNSSVGALRVSARTNATSFTITSSDLSDSGVVAWLIM